MPGTLNHPTESHINEPTTLDATTRIDRDLSITVSDFSVRRVLAFYAGAALAGIVLTFVMSSLASVLVR